MTAVDPTEVLIVGGGGVGCATALGLARRGVPVTMIEKGLIGGQASGVNFGGVRRHGRALAELPLANRARRIWPRLKALIGHDGEFVASGHLRLARSAAEMAEAESYAEAARAYDLDLAILDRRALDARFPWLAAEVVGASFCADDGSANPRLVAPWFARAARAAGAAIHERAEATAFARDGDGFRVTTRDGRAFTGRVLVNAAGAWGGHVAAAFDEPAPIETITPQMTVTEPAPYVIVPVLGMISGGLYLRQIPRGNVIFGRGRGVADMAAGRARVLPEVSLDNAAMAARLIPRLASLHVIRTWSGLEGEMPDGLPVIGQSRTTPGLLHAFGFSGHGFQLGPAVGEILAELATSGRTTSPIAPFDIARFAAAGDG